MRLEKVFQFLIGTLKTALVSLYNLKRGFEFQFLIGTLKTLIKLQGF